MIKRQVQIIILSEDLNQQNFARLFLIEQGFHPRKIRTLPIPQGEGSGEQYVRQHYAQEVKEYRNYNQKNPNKTIILIVLIDADKYTVEERLRQLNLSLIEASQLERQDHEKIGIFVPKWNIETWIKYLTGEEVNEEVSYKQKGKSPLNCKPYIETLISQCSVGLSENAPPSLQFACQEWQRIKALI